MQGRVPPVLVRGVGDVGSAVAIALLRAGYAVVLHDEQEPTTSRRGMAFADAVTLDGIRGRRADDAAELRSIFTAGTAIPIAVWPFSALLKALSWSAIVDARMRKHATPEHQRGNAPLAIGLGPNFTAGDNVDLAIETAWGDRLGAVIERGIALPLGSEPLGGVARGRFVYAPIAGRFETQRGIGDRVEQSAIVASIAGQSLCTPIAGVLRGLSRGGVRVAAQTKVIEVDPRRDPAAAFAIGVRPRLIAEVVLQALASARVPA